MRRRASPQEEQGKGRAEKKQPELPEAEIRFSIDSPKQGKQRPDLQIFHDVDRQQPKFPVGLSYRLLEAKASQPLRIWVIDNSGSMLASDGLELRNVGASSEFMFVACTRWQELKSTTIYHAKLAAAMNAPTMFRLLNNPGPRVGPQTFSIGMMETTHYNNNNTASITDQDLNLAISVMENAQPNGGTPLLHHLQEIRTQIEAMESSLRNNSQKVVLVLATDGLPTDAYGETTIEVHQEFILELKALQALPVWIVVRLCTDDPSIVEFYNNLDAQLELPLEVIDDFYGEAKEIQSSNSWLNYNLVLHRCREMGYQHRLFDLLDERLLNKDELREFLTLLFDEETIQPLPDVHGDWKGFVDGLAHLIATQDKHYNPLTNQLNPWIDIKQLKKCYKDSPKGGLCSRLLGRRK